MAHSALCFSIHVLGLWGIYAISVKGMETRSATAIAGESVTLDCTFPTLNTSDELSYMVWEFKAKNNPRDISTIVSYGTKDGYRYAWPTSKVNLTVKWRDGGFLTIFNVSFEDEGTFVCTHITLPTGRTKQQVNVTIYVLPKEITVSIGSAPTGLQYLPDGSPITVSEDSSLTLECRCGSSLPAASIIWRIGGVVVRDHVTDTTVPVSRFPHTLYNVTSHLTIPRVLAGDQGKNVSCATSDFGGSDALSTHVTLRVTGPPDLQISYEGEQPFEEGGQLTLTCRTLNVFTPRSLFWIVDNQILSDNDSQVVVETSLVVKSGQFEVVSKLVINPTRLLNGKTITCIHENPYQGRNLTDSIVLNVSFCPESVEFSCGNDDKQGTSTAEPPPGFVLKTPHLLLVVTIGPVLFTFLVISLAYVQRRRRKAHLPSDHAIQMQDVADIYVVPNSPTSQTTEMNQYMDMSTISQTTSWHGTSSSFQARKAHLSLSHVSRQSSADTACSWNSGSALLAGEMKAENGTQYRPNDEKYEDMRVDQNRTYLTHIFQPGKQGVYDSCTDGPACGAACGDASDPYRSGYDPESDYLCPYELTTCNAPLDNSTYEFPDFPTSGSICHPQEWNATQSTYETFYYGESLQCAGQQVVYPPGPHGGLPMELRGTDLVASGDTGQHSLYEVPLKRF